jgi:hypothetical protein
MKKAFSMVVALIFATSLSMAAGIPEHHQAPVIETAPGVVNVAATAKWFPSNPAVSGGKVTVRSIQYTSANVIWASGYTSTADYVYRSTDGGANWTQNQLPTKTGGFGACNVSAQNDSVAVIGLFNTGQLLRTQNGGAKWDTVYTLAGAYWDGVKFVSKDTVVAVSDAVTAGAVVVRSTDGGKTWAPVTLPAPVNAGLNWFGYATFGACMDSYKNTVWISLYSGTGVDPVIIKSTDAGAT